MPSLKSRLYYFIIRNRHLLKGKLKREVFDFSTSIPEFRELCEKTAAKIAKIPEGISVQRDSLDGINAEWLVPRGAGPEKLVLYVHGGGYVCGSCSDHRGFVSKFAKSCGVQNLVYDYRLAPEHPFPAALEDSITVYMKLLERGFRPHNMVIAGESAGGGLALAMLMSLRDRGEPLPAAAVVISPWADLTCSGGSYTTKNRKSVAPLNSWLVFSKYYAGSAGADNPLVSPLFGDPKGLPPLFINAGEDDELYDDAERFHKKAQGAGVDVTFRSGTGMIHCYPMLAPAFREATEAMDEIVEFIHKHIGGNGDHPQPAMPDYTVIPMDIGRYDEVRGLWKNTGGIGLSGADSRERIEAFLERNGGFSFVATAGGTVAGAVLGGNDGRRGYIYHLAVHPDFRCAGIGRSLVQACLAAFREAGLDKSHIFVLKTNLSAVGFWEKMGFALRDDILVMSSNIE